MLTESTFKGHYALVTGASAGLGRAFAEKIARMGMRLVLVARNVSDLNAVAEKLRVDFGSEVEVIACDLSRLDSLGEIRRRLDAKGIRVRLLVNNAGIGGWGDFENISDEVYSRMIDLNVKAPVLLSKLLLPDLRSFNESAIINVSSVASVQPVPFMAVYAATKSFLTHFSSALWNECEKYGIYVQTLMPGAIDTGFDEKSGGFKAPFKKDSVQDVVELSIANLMKKKPLVYAKGSLLQRFFALALPRPFLIREVGKVFSKR